MKVQVRVSENGKTYEGEVVLAEVRSRSGKREAPAAKPRPSRPSEALDSLYKKGFFRTERTLGSAVEQLGKDGYNFSRPSVLMALQSRVFLQRRGAKGSYRFVQKYPPSSD
jgi:hypothetical protein